MSARERCWRLTKRSSPRYAAKESSVHKGKRMKGSSATEQTVSINGMEMHYEIRGYGERLFCYMAGAV